MTGRRDGDIGTSNALCKQRETTQTRRFRIERRFYQCATLLAAWDRAFPCGSQSDQHLVLIHSPPSQHPTEGRSPLVPDISESPSIYHGYCTAHAAPLPNPQTR